MKKKKKIFQFSSYAMHTTVELHNQKIVLTYVCIDNLPNIIRVYYGPHFFSTLGGCRPEGRMELVPMETTFF